MLWVFGDPGHTVHHRKPPMTRVLRRAPTPRTIDEATDGAGIVGTPNTPWEATYGVGMVGTPGTGCTVTSHRGRGRRGPPVTPCITGHRPGTSRVGSVPGTG